MHVCLSVLVALSVCLQPPVTHDYFMSWTEGEATRPAFSPCPLSLLPPFAATWAQDPLTLLPTIHVSTEPLRACVRPGAGSQEAPPAPARTSCCPASTRGPDPGLDPVLELPAPLTLGRGPPQWPGPRPSETRPASTLRGLPGPPSPWKGKWVKGGGRQAALQCHGPALPAPVLSSALTLDRQDRGGQFGGSSVASHSPSSSAWQSLCEHPNESASPLGRTELCRLHFPRRRGLQRGGDTSPQLRRSHPLRPDTSPTDALATPRHGGC